MNMTVNDLIEFAITAEIVSRDLYTRFSELCADQPSLRDLWRRMSVDESSHASLLRDVRDALSPDQLARPLTGPEIESIRSIQEELADIHATQPRTLDDVYQLAHRLESSEINGIFRMLVLDGIETSTARTLISAQFEEHVDRLERFGHELGRPLRQAIMLRSE